MPDKTPAHDPKQLWRNQPAEGTTMTLETLRQKARELQRRTRLELLVNTMAAVLAASFAVYGILHARDLLVLLFVLAIGWAGAGQYFLHRGMWSRRAPGDAAPSSGLDFYRSEIERRRRVFRRVLQWSLGPLLLSIVAWILMMTGVAKQAGRSATAVLPFSILMIAWVIGLFVQRSRTQRALQRELDALRDPDDR